MRIRTADETAYRAYRRFIRFGLNESGGDIVGRVRTAYYYYALLVYGSELAFMEG